MHTLEKNIINSYGDTGKQWLDNLPATIEALSQQWHLTQVQPVSKMSWHFVALATMNACTPVVLKIGCDQVVIQHEFRALKHLAGHGAIRALDINNEHRALLLEQAQPGTLLKSHHALKIDETIHIYANIVKMIATRGLPDTTETHMRDWCDVIEHIHDPRIPTHYVDTAQRLKTALLNTADQTYLCHGDLHLENIIQQGTEWVAIDPKGIVADMAFEASAFDLVSADDMKDVATLASKLSERTLQLSKALAIDHERLLAWIFLRMILSAQWFIEDNGDPSQMLTLAQYVYPLIEKRSDSV